MLRCCRAPLTFATRTELPFDERNFLLRLKLRELPQTVVFVVQRHARLLENRRLVRALRSTPPDDDKSRGQHLHFGCERQTNRLDVALLKVGSLLESHEADVVVDVGSVVARMAEVRKHSDILNWFSALGILWVAVIAVDLVARIVLAKTNGCSTCTAG